MQASCQGGGLELRRSDTQPHVALPENAQQWLLVSTYESRAPRMSRRTPANSNRSADLGWFYDCIDPG